MRDILGSEAPSCDRPSRRTSPKIAGLVEAPPSRRLRDGRAWHTGLLIGIYAGVWLGLIASPSAAARSRSVKMTVTYREVDGHAILADVYRPGGDEVCPVIVWIHGGALIMGHRESIHPEVRALAEREGYALVSIDYRLAPETKLPALIGDVEAAFRWLECEDAGRFRLDPERVVVAGQSAGGYLALVAGYRARPRPRGVVALYGYGGLIGDWYSRPSPHPRHNPREIGRKEALRQTDGRVVSDSRQREGDGGLLYLYYRQKGLWPQEVSGFDAATIAEQIGPFEPARNVTPGYPPALLIHGTADTDVPYEESAMMAERLERNGVPCELVTIAGGEHGLDGGDPRQIGQAYERMRAFIVGRLAAE